MDPSRTLLTTFHLFARLPPEIRLAIWELTIHLEFVPIKWSQARRAFISVRKPPAILHCNQEARILGLKTYQLSFASSPEFARVYFSFEFDTVCISWDSLGSSPGRLGRKISNDEASKIKSILVQEENLLEHADENMREWSRFKNLESIGVICDVNMPESGDAYGGEAMAAYSEKINEPGEERWPSLVCLRDNQDLWDEPCSRHWWFDGWNQRARHGRKEKWPKTISYCLKMTQEQDEVDFWLDMMIMSGVGLPHFHLPPPLT